MSIQDDIYDVERMLVDSNSENEAFKRIVGRLAHLESVCKDQDTELGVLVDAIEIVRKRKG